MKLEKKNSKILRFSSVNFDRFHREKTNFRASLALTSPIVKIDSKIDDYPALQKHLKSRRAMISKEDANN
jgi:hypothetical protein